jgi:hypothetical protein
VFGNGKTAVRASLGRYPAEPAGAGYYGNNFNPILLVQTSTSRSWNDGNGNFVPDCDLLNPVANGECVGAWSNPNFGKQVFNTRYDPAIMTGWNKRIQTWDLNIGVQQQLAPRVGVEISYLRRIYGNFRLVDNLAVGPQDFDAFTVTVPTDSRLPSSGQQLTFVDVNPAKFGQQNYFVTSAENYGKQTRHYNGISLSVNARFGGITARGGFSAGRTVEDNCDLAAKLPELFTVGNGIQFDGAITGAGVGQIAQQFCHLETGLNPVVNGLATYLIPKVNLEVSGTVSSKSLSDARYTTFIPVYAESVQANLVMTNAQVRPLLGRNLAGNAPNTTIDLVQPGTLYLDRLTNFDLRLAHVQTFGTTRLRVAVDLYNVLNASTPVSYNQTYGSSFQVPTGILQARFAKVSAQFDF